MSQWTERVRNHQVWQQLTSLGPAIDQALARKENVPDALDGLERLRSVLTYCGKRLAANDPFLIHMPPIDGLAKNVERSIAEVNAYITDGNVGHIDNANAHADSILSNLAQLTAPFTQDDITIISESVSSYRKTLEQFLRDASKWRHDQQGEVDALRKKIEEVATELVSARERVSALTSEFQSQFSGSQEGRGREFTDAQAVRQEKFGELIADYNEKLTAQNAEFDRQIESATKNYEEELLKLKNQYEQSANAILDQINVHKAEVEKLVGVIGNLGVTSGYLKTANHARLTLWFWQLITVMALCGVIFVAYAAFIPLVQGGFTWEGFAARVFVSITVGVLAAYSASQADKSYQVERINRKRALELEALGPFLAPLPQEMQDKFRIEVGDRSFGHEERGGVHSTEKSPATLLDALGRSKDARDLLVQLVKAARE